MNKKIKKIILLCCTTLLFGTGCTNTSNKIKQDEVVTIKDEKQENVVTISAVGDVMVHGPQLEAQLLNDGTYNFDNNFKYIKNIISNSDISIANLETTINLEKRFSGYPSFNSPKELLKTLKDVGFDVISTINNHTLDTGYSGVLSTLNELKINELKSVGTKSNVDDKNYIIENINNIKIGISTFSYGDISNGQKYLNGIPSGKATNLLNVISSSNIQDAFKTIKNEIDLMKLEGVEFIIIGLHWGKEYEQNPTYYQKTLAQMLANEGVDLILGSHPHVVQPIEFVKSECAIDKETLVVYSMGNIISNQREEEMGFKESENGIIPIIDIEKDEQGKVSIKEVKYVPIWVNKEKVNDNTIYEIIPIDGNISQLSKEYNVSEYDLETSFNNTTSLMTDNKIKIYKKDV